ncbi:MAG: hypothetical protein WCE79_11155 [Xanthobacteraceae bacterium]
MSSALPVAGPTGEIVCLDKGNYNGASIFQPITISCGDALWEAPAGTVTVSTAAGTDVTIEGLVMDGLAVAGVGVNFIGQGSLHLHRVRIGNNGGPNGHGLVFAPTGSGTLHVSDSVFYNNGGTGIQVRPSGSGFANVHLRNVKVERSTNGLFIDGSASTVGINANISASLFTENSGNGIGAPLRPAAPQALPCR